MTRSLLISTLALALTSCGQQPADKAASTAAASAVDTPESRCVSAVTKDQLKIMAFNAARRLNSGDEVKFNDLERQSTAAITMPLLQSHDEALDRTICTGRLRIDPPVGARSMFGSDDLITDITYSMQPAADGTGLVYQVDDFGRIATSIAYADLSRFTSSENRPARAASTQAPTVPPAPLTTPSAGRASFNCNRASTLVERLICADPKLADLDRQMASLYAERRRAQPGSGEEQLAWIAGRNRCPDAACLYDVYQSRIDQLSY